MVAAVCIGGLIALVLLIGRMPFKTTTIPLGEGRVSAERPPKDLPEGTLESLEYSGTDDYYKVKAFRRKDGVEELYVWVRAKPADKTLVVHSMHKFVARAWVKRADGEMRDLPKNFVCSFLPNPLRITRIYLVNESEAVLARWPPTE